ncbi:hypothetical protein Tco_0058524 [Tanacetum coccineum]
MWESKSYQTHKDHMTLYEALEKSMARDNIDQLLSDLAEARKKKKKRQGSPKTPHGFPPHPPPPPPPSASGQSTSTTAPSSSKIVASAEYMAWTTTDTRIQPSVSPIPEELHMDDDTTADEQAYSSSGEDSWWKPITEDRPATPEPAWSIPSSALTHPRPKQLGLALKYTITLQQRIILVQIGDMTTFMDWYCKKQGISELTQKDLEGPAYEIVKVFHPDVVHLQFQMEECHKLLTDQVDDAILRYNVSKPLPLGGDPGHVTIQPDFFFNKDLEYLRYGRKMGRPALSISKMKAAYYPNVGLEQMVPDQMWIEEECKYDVATMYGISHWWFQRQRFYIDRHTSEGNRRAVRTHMRILSVVRIEVFPMYGYNYMKKIVIRRANLKEYIIGKGTSNICTLIDEALDYRVKEFKVNRMNLGLDTQFWTKKDVDRSKEFMFAIQKRLKTRHEKDTLADVETDTEEILIPTENSGEEVSNTVVLGTESGGQDDKQGGLDPSDSAESKPLPS